MNFTELQRFLKKYGTLFTAVEVIDVAFVSAEKFSSWEAWLEKVKVELTDGELKELASAANEILEDLSEKFDSFASGAITIEQSAGVGLEKARRIPRKFPEFIKAEVKKEMNARANQ